MPRKTRIDRVEPGRIDRVASMRPRPDAAENRPGRARGRGQLEAASMRPRPDAAENPAVPYSTGLGKGWLQ